VSGVVNLSNFPAELTFDCLCVLGVGGPEESPATPPLPAETLTQIDNIEANVNLIARRLSIVPQE